MHFPAGRNTGRRSKGKGTENFWGLQKKFLQIPHYCRYQR